MNALVDLIPARARKFLYAFLAAGLAAYGVWQAVDGDWVQFAVAVGTAAVNALAAANTQPEDLRDYEVPNEPVVQEDV